MASEGGVGARGRTIWWIVGLLVCSALGITRGGLLPFPAGGWAFTAPRRSELRSGPCADLSISPSPVAPVASAPSLTANVGLPLSPLADVAHVPATKPLLVTSATASSVRGSRDTVLVATRVIGRAVILGGVVATWFCVLSLRTSLTGAVVAVEAAVVADSVHFSSMLQRARTPDVSLVEPERRKAFAC